MPSGSIQVEQRNALTPTNSPTSAGFQRPFRIGAHEFTSRLIMGSGRYESFEVMQQALTASSAEIVTFAVRRERLHDSSGRNILDFVDISRFHLLPNTAGCYDASTAVRSARMGREILRSLNVRIVNWVKLEVLGDSRSLLPDPIETLRATEMLVAEGFEVPLSAVTGPGVPEGVPPVRFALKIPKPATRAENPTANPNLFNFIHAS